MNLDLKRVVLLNTQMKVLYTYFNSFMRETITCDSASSQSMGEACANRILSFTTRGHRMVDLYFGRDREGNLIKVHQQTVGDIKARYQTLDPDEALPGKEVPIIPVRIDAPDNGPISIADELDVPNVLTEVQNEFIYNSASMFGIARNEAVLCQSARNRSGIEPFDAKRIRSYMDNIMQTIYFSLQLEPLDMPKTNPNKRVHGAGNRYGDEAAPSASDG